MTTTSEVRRRPRLYYGWIIVAVVGLGGFTQSAETHPVLSIFLKPITEEFNWSRSVFVGAVTIGTLIGGLVAMGIGPLTDRFGGRWTLVIGFVILGSTIFLKAWIGTLWQFYVLQILARIVNMGVISLALQVIIPKWFVAKRGRAVAIGSVAMMLGNAVAPLYVQLLISIADWRVATAAMGITVWTLAILPSALFLRRQPEDIGLLPDGATPEEVSKHPPLASEVAGAGSQVLEASLSLRQVVRLASFYLLLSAFGLVFIAIPAMHLHLFSFFTDRGLAPGIAVAVVSVFAAGAGVGSLLFGILAERYSIRLMLSANFLLTAVGFLLLLAIHSSVPALLWGMYMGLAQGGIFTLQQVLLANYYGRDSLGAVRGVVWPVQMGANSLGPLAAALAYDATGNYTVIFTLFAAMTLLSALLATLARPPAVASG